ncbi:GH116 family glycosyl-hydrolase [Tunturiibacter empetritectus]|uniref:Uncharacterized protein (DUF608 family) n=2 Tax=Tunturiibacter TaxID=3154218 RepID=A0A852VAM5_9BACT|nr:uncharacterized protein (DUF608 family) [Edaphobacter lichenicola]
MKERTSRRTFVKQAALGAVLLPKLDTNLLASHGVSNEKDSPAATPSSSNATPTPELNFPRTFTGRNLARIAFPVGGIGTGGVELGGRGDLRLWQIFNRPESGDLLRYTFAAIHVEGAGAAPFTSILERKLLPPYDQWDYREGIRGVGALDMPRMTEAVFSSSFPVAKINFSDPHCPVDVSLTAFSPFYPVDADDSGLPIGVFEYNVKNTSQTPATVAIALSIENPCHGAKWGTNVLRSIPGSTLPTGVFMTNPTLAVDAPKSGSFALLALPEEGSSLQLTEAWPNQGIYSLEKIWKSFAADGSIPKDFASEKEKDPIGSASIRTTIAAGSTARFRFLLAWHYPNRTPEGIGWGAPKGMEKVNLGNFYATRFHNAWEVAEYTIKNLPELERRTHAFAATMRDATLPASVKDAAASNLSTLVSNTSFRIADGSFHGYEGCSNSTGGQGPGSCTHVWNYEVATSYVFPALSRSMRETSFGYATQASGHMDFRHKLPLGYEHFTLTEPDHQAAADGQMGQIVRLYLDWRISGDTPWMLKYRPAAKRALAYAWIKGGWDANRDGVMEGAQHNTYDIQFLGPTGMMQSWYLAALRASAAMAKAANDNEFAAECERIEQAGREWTDKHLFQGEFYIQQIRPVPLADVDPALLSGEINTADPHSQLGPACHIDQIIGQYMAGMAGLGDLLSADNMRTALRSIHRYNQRMGPYAMLGTHRMYAVNDEPALRICAYKKPEDIPVNPMAYSSENWCGLEHAVSATMIQYGLIDEAIQHVTDVRARHDGESRNPMDELEWGHHYARSMASWALIPALSGFRHDAVLQQLTVQPKMSTKQLFRSPWTSNTGWGELRFEANTLTLTVIAGELNFDSLVLPPECGVQTMKLGEEKITAASRRNTDSCTLQFKKEISLTPQQSLRIRYAAPNLT